MARAHPADGVTDVSQVIDNGVWSAFQKATVIVGALAIVLDGFANQVLPLSIPMMVKMWGVARSDFQWVQAAGYAGMMIGTITFGMLGDRIGRKPTLIAGVLLFAVPTIAIALTHGLGPLYLLRFIGGMGLGGCMPNAAALTAEVTPARARPVAVSLSIAGIPAGGMIGGFIAARVPAEHWPTLYYLAGLAPLTIAVLMIAVLPESPRFLAVRPHRKADLVKLMARFDNPIDPNLPAVDSLERQAKAKVKMTDLFSKDYARDTTFLWGTTFFTLLSVFGVINWLPSILGQARYPGAMSGGAMMWFNLGGVVASMAAAAGFNRFGSKACLMTLAGGAVAASVALAFIPLDPAASPLPLLTALTLQGACINGVQTTVYALAAFVYVTEMRGAGIGWAVGIGRIGSIVSPVVGNALLEAFGPHGFFLGFGAAMFVSLACLALITHHMPAKRSFVAVEPVLEH